MEMWRMRISEPGNSPWDHREIIRPWTEVWPGIIMDRLSWWIRTWSLLIVLTELNDLLNVNSKLRLNVKGDVNCPITLITLSHSRITMLSNHKIHDHIYVKALLLYVKVTFLFRTIWFYNVHRNMKLFSWCVSLIQ